MSKNNKEKKVNIKSTLIGIRERQEKLDKIKKEKELKCHNEQNKILFGVELLYNIMKKQNHELLGELNETFKKSLSFDTDLQSEFVKPPYLTPKIVSHKLTKILNQT